MAAKRRPLVLKFTLNTPDGDITLTVEVDPP